MDVRKKSQKQEKAVAKSLNGRVVPASGALWGAKGDVRTDNLLIECKTTDKSSYPLKSFIWNKIKKEAISDGLRLPVMIISVAGVSFAVVEKAALEDFIPIDYTFREVKHKSFLITSDTPEWSVVGCYEKSWNTGTEFLVIVYADTFEELVERGVFDV